MGQKFRKIVKSIKYDNSSVPYNVADTTDYLQGFQYTNSKLSFFPVAGGYVKHTVSGTVHNYSYIYHYTDHLGNIRLSYTRNNDGTPAVMEENHYYPFGLKHENYSAEVLDIMAPEENLAVGGGFETNVVVDSRKSYQYKYQGQERQDELGLNWDSFKYRNYDYAIGRFMSIDPLAEKYPYNSTYAFQENKMGMGVELEGLELFSPWIEVFVSTSDAVKIGTELATKTEEHHIIPRSVAKNSETVKAAKRRF